MGTSQYKYHSLLWQAHRSYIFLQLDVEINPGSFLSSSTQVKLSSENFQTMSLDLTAFIGKNKSYFQCIISNKEFEKASIKQALIYEFH